MLYRIEKEAEKPEIEIEREEEREREKKEREREQRGSWQPEERTIHHERLKVVSFGDQCPSVSDAKAWPNIVKGPEKAGT